MKDGRSTHTLRGRRELLQLLASGVTVGTIGLAGCSSSANQTEPQEEEQEPQTGQIYFQDQTGTLGHLAEPSNPANAEDWQVISNDLSEDDWQEKQENDIWQIERRQIDNEQVGLNKSVDEYVQRAEEIFLNEEFNHDYPKMFDISAEDDEVTFTRALIKSVQEDPAVDTSGLADDVIANLAEHAATQIDAVDFNDYKLSTVPATESLAIHQHTSPNKGAPEGGNVNSSFTHMPAVLQYNKNGETEVKYTELTDPLIAGRFFESIRDPENSKYQSGTDEEEFTDYGHPDSEFFGYGIPEHFVTALDYTKVRELEQRDEDILGFGPNRSPSDNDQWSVGDKIDQFLNELVDDVYITGYSEDGEEINPDLNRSEDANPGKTVVSDEFGGSLEEYVLDPDPETRQYMENVGRGLYTIRQQEGWDTNLALTGTLQNPEITATTIDQINEIREQHAYNEVRDRVAA